MFPFSVDIWHHVVVQYLDFETLYLGRETSEFQVEYQRRLNSTDVNDVNVVITALKHDDLDLLQSSNYHQIPDVNLLNLSGKDSKIRQWLVEIPRYRKARAYINRVRRSLKNSIEHWSHEAIIAYESFVVVSLCRYLDYALEVGPSNPDLNVYILEHLEEIKQKRTINDIFDSLEEYQKMFLFSENVSKHHP